MQCSICLIRGGLLLLLLNSKGPTFVVFMFCWKRMKRRCWRRAWHAKNIQPSNWLNIFVGTQTWELLWSINYNLLLTLTKYSVWLTYIIIKVKTTQNYFGFKIVFTQSKVSFSWNLFQKSLLYYHNKNELWYPRYHDIYSNINILTVQYNVGFSYRK